MGVATLIDPTLSGCCWACGRCLWQEWQGERDLFCSVIDIGISCIALMWFYCFYVFFSVFTAIALMCLWYAFCRILIKITYLHRCKKCFYVIYYSLKTCFLTFFGRFDVFVHVFFKCFFYKSVKNMFLKMFLFAN